MRVSLKAARVNANLRQIDAAKKTGVAKTTIISWEKGETHPRADQLETLCSLYNAPIDDIILRVNNT